MSVVGAVMDGENDHSHGGHAANLQSPTLTSESTDSDPVTPGHHSDLEDVSDGSPFDVLQRAVSQIPCRQTQSHGIMHSLPIRGRHPAPMLCIVHTHTMALPKLE